MTPAGGSHRDAAPEMLPRGVQSRIPGPVPKSAFQHVAEGIVRITIPFHAPPGDVNVWLLDDGDGWVVVDTGWPEEATKTIWQAAEEVFFVGKPAKRLLLTHFHIDHSGLCPWLCDRWKVPLSMTRTEWMQSRVLMREPVAETIARQVELLEAAGLPAADIAAFTGLRRTRPSFPGVEKSFDRLQAGQILKIGGTQWQVIIGRGHAPEMACLYAAERKILISADQMLPRITPHIGVWMSERDSNPLGEFLASIEPFNQLPADTLVLPSHGDPFVGLHATVAYAQQNHANRLELVMQRCVSPATVADLTAVLFKPQPPSRIYSAVSETAAHIRYLEFTGDLTRSERDDGVWLFERT